MAYRFAADVEGTFDEVVQEVTDALKAEGFGVLTTIDVAATLKNKIGADMRPYKILGACHPTYAYEALCAEDKIGTMLPCNVVVHVKENGLIEVAAIDPIASMQAVRNPALAGVATTIQGKLRKVIESLS